MIKFSLESDALIIAVTPTQFVRATRMSRYGWHLETQCEACYQWLHGILLSISCTTNDHCKNQLVPVITQNQLSVHILGLKMAKN